MTRHQERFVEAVNRLAGCVITADVADALIHAHGIVDRPPPFARASNKKEAVEFLRGVLIGNEDAIALILDLVDVSHVWDDLIDKDKPVPDESIHRAFSAALGLHANPFFAKHAAVLGPVMLAGQLNWWAANDIEAEPDSQWLPLAYGLRCAVGDVVHLCAYLIGGLSHAKQNAAAIRVFVQQDTFDEYMQSMKKEGRHANQAQPM